MERPVARLESRARGWRQLAIPASEAYSEEGHQGRRVPRVRNSGKNIWIAAFIPLLIAWNVLCLCPHPAAASPSSVPGEHHGHCADGSGGSAPADSGSRSGNSNAPCPHCGGIHAVLGPTAAQVDASLSLAAPLVPLPVAWIAEVLSPSRTEARVVRAKPRAAPPSVLLRTRVLLI
jgi:hypothetical protein